MAVQYTIKIDGNTKTTTATSATVTGTPYGLYPNSSRGSNTTWYSVAYCWQYTISGTKYYQYSTMQSQVKYTQNAASTKLITPKFGGTNYTTYYKASNTSSALNSAVGASNAISSGTIYDANGNAHTLSITATPVVNYYTVTVQKRLDNGSLSTVSSSSYKEGSNVSIPIPAAYANSVLSGVTQNGGALSYSAGGYSVSNISTNYTFIFSFTSKVAVTIQHNTGAKYIYASSTTTFTGEGTSATCTSGAQTIYVQPGASLFVSAESYDGYVLYSNAITASVGSYGTITGNGSTYIDAWKTCTSAVTFTVNCSQFWLTPAIANSAQSGWGAPTINGSTSSVVLKPNTTYTLGFSSYTAGTLAAQVSYWSIGGGNYSTTFTTGATVTGSLTAYLYLQQTRWQLTVANGTNASWGGVYLGASGTETSGWFASGTNVTVRFVSAMASTIAPQASQINYNGSTASCGNTATITTTSASLTATMYLSQTRWTMSLAYGNSGTETWGEIMFKRHSDSAWVTGAGRSIYVATGEQIDLRFGVNSSLVQTIHPQLDHWTFLQQTSSPTPESDGSSSVTVTLGSVSANFTAYAYLASAWRKVTIQRTDSGAAAWGRFYLGESGTDTVGYYAPGTTITMRFVRDTSYDTKERPQVNGITIGTESSISGVDGTYSYTYTLPSGVKTDLTISCTAKQTAWPVAVSSGGNGSVRASRVDIGTGTVVQSISAAGTIYLRSGTTAEYLAVTPPPDAHFAFSAWTKNNLSDYGGDASHVQLSTAANATISAAFERSEFCITGTSDLDAVCDVYMQDKAEPSAYYPISATANPVVVCKIKATYADQYKVASFSIGSQDGIAPQYNAAADLYYVEVASRSDVTVTAHVVQTYFNLSVNVSPGNKTDFGTVVVSSGDQELARDGFAGRLREGTAVSIVFYEKYGGRVVQIVPSDEIDSPVQTDSAISFAMPSADCSVSLTLGAKETYALTVGVVNLASGDAATIPGIVRVASRTYPNVVVGATEDDGVAKTFTVYKGEEYSLVASPVSDYLSRRYAFIGWRDASAAIPGATDASLNILNTSEASLTRYASYNARGNGTITIEYAKKEGATITSISADEAKYLLTIDNTEDMYDATHWLIGTDVRIGYTAKGSAYDHDGDAYKWTPVQVDVALASDDYGTSNAIWDDGLLTQNGSFAMLGDMKVRLVLTQTHVPGYTTMHVGLKQSTILMGEVSLFSTEMDAHTSDSTGATALVKKQKKAVIMAAPRPGYAFAGWFTYANGEWTAVEGASAVFEIGYVTSPTTTYYAQFVASVVSNVKEWNGNPNVAKTCEWRSKVYVGSQFFNLSCCRVYADAYPVTLKVFTASSPEGVFGDNARTVEVTITGQGPRRLPMMRPEKYFAFKVSGYARINHVGIGSSMEALK